MRRRHRIQIAVAGLVAVTVAAGWPVWPAIAVAEEDSVIGYVPLAEDERFGLTFRHSVDRLPVQDWYVVRDDTIVQDATRLVQFGAGMGHIPGQGTGRPAGRGTDGAWWEVHGLDRPIGELAVRVGERPIDHRLRYPDGELALSECWPHERVTVRAVRLPTAALAVQGLLRPPDPDGGCAR